MKKNFEYEPDLDILYISRKTAENTAGSLVLDNLVFDVSNNGEITGVEIDCASKVFNLTSDQLQNLNVAELKVVPTKTMLKMCISLAAASKEQICQIMIPSNKIVLAR